MRPNHGLQPTAAGEMLVAAAAEAGRWADELRHEGELAA